MLHITTGNGKLDQINSINTNPLSNEFCLTMSKKPNTICNKCYSMRTLRRWRQVEKPLERNTIELSECILPMSDLPIINALYFRFNSHGELINRRHLMNLLKICRKNPKTRFALWSKRIDVIKELYIKLYQARKPTNLVLIYSSPLVNQTAKIPFQYFDKVFTVFTEKFAKENNIDINCKKKCITCLKCYLDNDIAFINEIIK